jgi:hypothetical protein
MGQTRYTNSWVPKGIPTSGGINVDAFLYKHGQTLKNLSDDEGSIFIRPRLAEEICSGSGSIILGGFGGNTTAHGYFRFDTRGFEEAS